LISIAPRRSHRFHRVPHPGAHSQSRPRCGSEDSLSTRFECGARGFETRISASYWPGARALRAIVSKPICGSSCRLRRATCLHQTIGKGPSLMTAAQIAEAPKGEMLAASKCLSLCLQQRTLIDAVGMFSNVPLTEVGGINYTETSRVFIRTA